MTWVVAAVVLAAALLQLWRAAKAVARLRSERLVGAGPGGSLVVADGELLVARGPMRPVPVIAKRVNSPGRTRAA